MIRLTLRNIRANRARFALTTVAVVLGVSFVVSSFVLTDGLRSTFGDLSDEIVSGTDLELRPSGAFGSPTEVAPPALDEVQAIPGVLAAAPLVEAGENDIRPLNRKGEGISTNGPPQLMFGWIDDEQLSPFSLVEGTAPEGNAAFTMDVDAADKHGFVVGVDYEMITPTGTTQMTLSGLTRFGEDNATVGATLMHMGVEGLLEVTGRAGYNAVQVALDTDASADVVAASMAAIDPELTVVDNATLASEQQQDFDEGINLIGNVMLGFAGVSLFVSLFIIYNTFSIVLGQRTRELALLRTVGADAAQLRRSVLGEAFAIGLLASATGIPAGLGVAVGLDALFGAIGADLPDYPIIVSTRTIVVALVVGIGMTLASAFGPARRAAKVAPIAALTETETSSSASLGRLRLLSGTLLLGVGVGAGAFGLFVTSATSSTVLSLALGAMGVFVGVTVLSPVIAGPATRALRVPFGRLGGVSGRLAADNAARSPRRTATTAAALMIGLALVSMALVVGESVKAQLHATLASSVKADFLVTDETSESGFPAQLTSELAALPETANVAGFSYDTAQVGDSFTDVVGTDLAQLDALFDIDLVSGVASDVGVPDPLLISTDVAEANNLVPGDMLAMTFASGLTVDFTVTGVYGEEFVFDEGYVADSATWQRVGAHDRIDWLALSGAPNVAEGALDTALQPLRDEYPGATFETFGQYIDRFEGFIDQALTALNVMVALAVIIALIGIANTLALSVFERTRELGLLRAVGMTRPQLRRMIRLEAAVVALFGATLGIAIGVAFGWAAVAALPATITSTLAVPYMRIAILVAVAGAAGLLAAWGPARRAGRLNVLDAIGG